MFGERSEPKFFWKISLFYSIFAINLLIFSWTFGLFRPVRSQRFIQGSGKRKFAPLGKIPCHLPWGQRGKNVRKEEKRRRKKRKRKKKGERLAIRWQINIIILIKDALNWYKNEMFLKFCTIIRNILINSKNLYI